MADARWLVVVGMAALLFVVPTVVCVGLMSDDDEVQPPTRRRPVDPPPSPIDRVEVPAPEPSGGGGAAPAPPPRADGQRSLRGEVRNHRGQPVEGAEVFSEATDRHDQTDDRGRYLINRQPLGELVLVASAPGYRRRRVVVPAGEGGEERLDLRLEPGPAPAGRVVDPEGRVAGRATVSCIGEADVETDTDWDGRFELGEEAVGCSARALHPDFAASPVVTLVAGPDNLLTLVAPGAIVGTVVDEGGRPVRTFVVAVESFRDPDGRSRPMHYRQTFHHPRGRFTVPRLEAGRYVLSVSRRAASVKTEALEVAPGQAPARLRVTLP